MGWRAEARWASGWGADGHQWGHSRAKVDGRGMGGAPMERRSVTGFQPHNVGWGSIRCGPLEWWFVQSRLRIRLRLPTARQDRRSALGLGVLPPGPKVRSCPAPYTDLVTPTLRNPEPW
jgi:hypothetical protein